MATLWTARASTQSSITNGSHAFCAKDRTVYLVYISGGNVNFKKSTDEGASWGSSSAVATAVEVPLDHPLAIDPVTGTLHLLYARQVSSAGLPAQLYYRRSTDDGASWSSEVTIDDGTSHGNNRFWRIGVAAENGKTHLFYASISSSNFLTDGMYYRRSTDDGVTWAAATQPFPSAVSPTRPDMELSGTSGTIVHVVWTDARHGSLYGGNPGEVYYGRSTDGGDNWSETRITTTAVTWGSGSTARTAICAADSYVNIVWQDPGNTPGSEDLFYTHSSDYGANWGSNQLLVSNANPQEHAFLAQRGSTVSLVWADYRASPSQMYSRLSFDGGATYEAEEIPAAGTNNAPAPRTIFTTNFILSAYTENSPATLYTTRRGTLPIPMTLVLDDFNRADTGPPPSANWSQGPLTFTAANGVVVASNAAKRKTTGSFHQDDFWNPITFGPDSEVFCTITNKSTTSEAVRLFLRLKEVGSGTSDGYMVNSGDGGTSEHGFARVTNAATTTIGSNWTQAIDNGDQILFRIIGSTLLFYIKPVSTGIWELSSSVVDTNYAAAGSLGLGFGGTSVVIDDFGGGSLILPNQPLSIKMIV